MFERPPYKQSKNETLFLQMAESGAVIAPALAPIGFGSQFTWTAGKIMDAKKQQTKQIQEPTASEDQTQATTAEADHEEPVTPTPLQRFRALLDSAQRSQNPVASRRELGRDKSKSLFVLVGASVADCSCSFSGCSQFPQKPRPTAGRDRAWS